MKFILLLTLSVAHVTSIIASDQDLKTMSPPTIQNLEHVSLKYMDSNEDKLSSEGINVNRVKAMIINLCTYGYEEQFGNDQLCRSICVSLQGILESSLAKMLSLGQLESVDAIFLTPLPITPLRKHGATTNLSDRIFERSCQFTLDLREITIRQLRDAGGKLIIAYSLDTYHLLKSCTDIGSQEQVSIWEKEKLHDNIMDIPLVTDIPKDIIGAIYIIKDREREYCIVMQAVQSKSTLTHDTFTWKIWLSQSNEKNPGTDQAIRMLAFINASA
ncbi:hypothetical protein CP10139811_0483 [Chlamydia ibidis]|uniref:Uncharacterized protein n=2 Tax=Chlamydia ibidis TaxID=1405396 RepID=S7J355_9CHLA|nr:hypothetical protein [Chlamydia ibidis]EPP34829.1 hypothetical protein CP10139811_0483 [Chlamydia ibidis]EQM62321.1 hypothetical protein H359_0861 [Chlamydia ibidis 10-1398/6]